MVVARSTRRGGLTTTRTKPESIVEMASHDGLRASLHEPVARVEELLESIVGGLDLPRSLRDTMAYGLLGGGKRLRPLLALHCSRAVGGSVDAAAPAGAAVEMIHAFSLMHDDLPALDDDDLRRGRPTVHKQFGEAMAILAGDGLMSAAFQVLAERYEDPSVAGRLALELSRGTTAMIGGQVLDTLGGFDEGQSDEQKLRAVHDNKTGALIRASCRMGAIAGTRGAVADEVLERVTTFGNAVGLMFQVVDDLLDVEQTTEHLGKRTSKDEDAGKLTYPGVLGPERSRAFVSELESAAVEAARALPEGHALVEIATYLARRTR